MKEGEEYKAMQALRDSDGWRFVVIPAFEGRRKALGQSLLDVDNMKRFWEVKHAILALDYLVSLVETMGDPEREPDLEDTSLRPSEGM